MVLVAAAGVVVAVVLAVLLLRERRLHRQLAASERNTALERDRAVADGVAAVERAHGMEAARDEALDRAGRARRDAADVARRLQEETAARAAAERASDRAQQELQRDRTRLRQQIEQLESEVAELRADLEGAQARGASGGSSSPGALPAEVVWDLEMARIERMWRTSVALDPFEQSPLREADEPLRTALEILADAAHEDSGADITICWRNGGEGPVPPHRSVVVLALVECIVSATAKADDPTVIRVTASGDGVEVRLEGGDADPDLRVPPSLVAGERRYLIA